MNAKAASKWLFGSSGFRSLWLMMGVVSLLTAGWGGAEAGPEPRRNQTVLDRAQQWEAAALNREMAAATQERQAAELIETADQLRRKEYGKEAERRGNLRKTGDAEALAGDLLAAAFVNYEKALANWASVGGEYQRADEPEKEAHAKGRSVQAAASARLACEKASQAYERAAEAFGADGSTEPAKEAAASEKAAVHREQLALRK